MELIADVKTLLKSNHMEYRKQAVLGGTRPDIIVTTEQGAHVVLEVKG